MYRAKDAGRNTYQFFSRDVQDAMVRRSRLDQGLRGALERGELSLSYQPQYDVSTGVLAGMEALARWRHPLLGEVAPDEFVPLLEGSGLMRGVGAWILESACRQAVSWRAVSGLFPRVAVNLSGRQLDDPDFADIVLAALAKAGLEPERLELEITEREMMHDLQAAERGLAALRDAGMRISLDDFGSGYSSLTYLRRLPVTGLKIDRCFVADIGVNRPGQEMVAALIALGHELRLEVVAEGVETEIQLEYLRERGCDLVQGYLCGRPVLAADTGTVAPRLPPSAAPG